MDYEIHPAAELFPKMLSDDFEALLQDIRDNGVRLPIVLSADGRLVDGRHRHAACKILKIEAPTVVLPTDVEIYAWVISTNLHRRQLSTTQRAIIAARLANMDIGANQHKKEGVPIGTPSPSDEISLQSSAAMLNVSRRSVARAKQLLDKGCENLVSAAEDGLIRLSAAVDFATANDIEQQLEVLSDGIEAVREVLQEARQKPAKQPAPSSGKGNVAAFVEQFQSLGDGRLLALKKCIKLLAEHEWHVVLDWMEQSGE